MLQRSMKKPTKKTNQKDYCAKPKGIRYKNLNAAKAPFTKIYVGNLVYTMDEADIHKIFSRYGKVGKIQIIRDKKTQKSTGIAFLQMFNAEHAQQAISKLNGKEINGRTLKVSVAIENSKASNSVKAPKSVKPARSLKKPRFKAKPSFLI